MNGAGLTCSLISSLARNTGGNLYQVVVVWWECANRAFAICIISTTLHSGTVLLARRQDCPGDASDFVG
jgi:hypothetical protein